MTAHKVQAQEAPEAQVETVNEVRLVGRLAADPLLRELPSGDTVWSLRLVVERPQGTARERQSVDWIDCAVRGGRVKRSVAAWAAGDLVEVAGALRRRFFRVAGATASRVEVELSRGRLIRRGGSG